MKKLLVASLMLGFLQSCADKDLGPSMTGTFSGPVSIRNEQNGFGTTSYDQADLTLKQLSSTSVEVSSSKFTSFVIRDLQQTGTSSYSAGDGTNIFRYSGGASSRSLLIDWTTEVSNGQPQTIRFGGEKKK